MKKKKSKRGFIGKFFSKFFDCFVSERKLYHITAWVSLVIRGVITYFMPNPFEPIVGSIFNWLYLPDWGFKLLSWVALQLIDNLFLANFMHTTSYKTVGNYYKRGTDGVFGSASYLVIYIVQYASLIVGIRWFEWYTIFPILGFYLVTCTTQYLMSYFNITDTPSNPNTYCSHKNSNAKRGYALPDKWGWRLFWHIVIFGICAAGIIIVKIFIS